MTYFLSCVSWAPKRSIVYLEAQFESNKEKKTCRVSLGCLKMESETYLQADFFLLKTVHPRRKAQPALPASDVHTLVPVSLKLLATQAQSAHAKGA